MTRRLRKSVHRALAPPVFRAMGLDVFGHYRWLRASASWAPEQRAEWRLRRLGEMLEFCWRHVPFYAEFWGDHGLSIQRLSHLGELEAYPVLTKDLFKDNWDRLIPDVCSSIPQKRNSTGGTTGEPLQYSMDLEHWSFVQAFHMWGWEQSGYQFGDPVGILAGYSLIPEDPSFKVRIRYALERKLALSAVHLDSDLSATYCRILNQFRAEYIYGYPSAISVFASHLADRKLKLPHLKGVITTAEMLLPQYRQKIEGILGVPVFNHLGCNDGGYSSYECALHDGFHYNDLQSLLEVWAPDSEGNGELLITNLWNWSMPFVRYANGDMIRLTNEPCLCGQPFPRISSINGRTMDLLEFSNGCVLSGPALTLIFRDMTIDGWQVVQTAKDKLEVRVLARNGQTNQDYFRHIEKAFAYHLPKEVHLDIIPVTNLIKSRNGKLKMVLSEIP